MHFLFKPDPRVSFFVVAVFVYFSLVHVILQQRLPLDYVSKMPRCLESSMAQSKRDVSNEQAESDSDSGNSLFITQKPVPEAVRSGRRRNYDLLSNLTSPEDVVERQGGSSSSNEEPRTVKKDGRKKCEPPKYTFPFLAKGRRRPRGKLLPIWNKTLNNFVMGGFFKCVRELLEGYQREGDVDSALPTEDMEGDYISPLSEAEEMSEDEDVRVVEKKCFVKPSKRISRQTWCTNATQQRRRKVGNAGQETSPGAQTKLSNEIPAEELCEPGEVHRSPRQYTQKNKEATTEPQNDVLHTDDLSQTGLMEDEPERQSILHSLPDLFSNSNDSECSETINTRKKKKKDRDPECAQPDGLHVAKSVNVKVQETPSLSEGSRAELSAMQTREQEINERSAVKNLSGDATVMRQEKGDIPDSKQKKKKRKKSASEHFRQEVDGNLESGERMEDSMISVSCNLENIGKKREKKRKRRDKDDDESQSSAAVECLNDDAEIRMNKKKRKKEETVIVEEDCDEKEASNKTSVFPPMSTEQFQESSAGLKNSAPFEETLESSYVEIKQHNKKLQSSSLDVSQDGEEGVGVNFSNDAGTLRESTGTPLKKKKKKKRRKRHDEDVDPLQSSTTTDPLNDGAEIQTKKKKRKKEEAIPFGEECEEKEASNRTSDLSLMSKNQFEQSGNGLGNSAESETSEQSHIKRKKHKKKQQSSSMDVSQDGEEGVGVNFSNDAGTLKEGTATPLKKKKKKKRSDGDVDPLQSSTATDPLNDDVEIQTKKKNRNKEEANLFEEECEEKEASNWTSDLLPMSKGQFEESGIGLGNSTESETLEQSHIKRKKHKKKKQSTSNDTQDGEEGVDKSFCEDIVTSEESTGVSLKKKKKKKILFSSEGYLLDFLEKC